MASVVFRRGDQVEVWSNSRGAWVAGGIILEAPQVDSFIEGYAVPKGAVKVSYAENNKWIMPEEVPRQVRRPVATGGSGGAVAAGPTVPATPPAAHGTVAPGRGRPSLPVRAATAEAAPRCKHDCGRPVQPGLTRGMKPFDTCCKRCAMSSGGGEHDPNCGGVTDGLAVSPDLGVPGVNPREWLTSMLSESVEFQRRTEQLFKEAAGRETVLRVDQAWDLIERRLLEPIGETIEVSEVERAKAAEGRRAGARTLRGLLSRTETPDVGVDLEAFRDLVRAVLRRRGEEWFPMKLPAKTHSFVRKNPNKLEEVYELGAKLGEGSFGVVYSVVHRVSGERRVCKRIAKLKGRDGMKVDEILREIENMAMLDHPNVIKVYEYFEDRESITQIMEPCHGGELQERIDAVFRKRSEPRYTEAFMCDVMKQTLRALAFIHSERYLHKDLKPQNIMLVDKAVEGATSGSIKVIDFGLAELFTDKKEVSDQFGGTLLYMAPEVFKLELTMKSDIWSVGVILYNLITGDYPFMATWPLPPGKTMEWWQSEVGRAIQDPREPMRSHRHLTDGSVSRECVDVLRLMLTKDAARRPDATGCLTHAWFRKFEQALPPLSVGVTQCLEAYSICPELKKAFFLLIAHQSTAPALQELRAIFTHFDVDNSGALSLDSFREVLRRSGMGPLKVEQIVYALDRDDSGSVQWTEFIAAALCFSVCRSKPLVDAAFHMFDADGDGRISTQDVLDVFGKGAVAGVWRDRIGDECAKMAPDRPKTFKGPYTKENFEAFMGSRIKTTTGDALRAVQ